MHEGAKNVPVRGVCTRLGIGHGFPTQLRLLTQIPLTHLHGRRKVAVGGEDEVVEERNLQRLAGSGRSCLVKQGDIKAASSVQVAGVMPGG